MAKPKNKKFETAKIEQVTIAATPSRDLDFAWVTGITGVITTIACALWFHFAKVLTKGIFLFDTQLTAHPQDSILVILILICLAMAGVELIRQSQTATKPFILIDPSITAGQHFSFFAKCVGIFLISYFLLWLVEHFYQTGGEYGFTNNSPFYQPFFRFFDQFAKLYFWLGLPYILVTRAYKYNPIYDRHDHHFIVSQLAILVASYVPGLRHLRPSFGNDEKTAWLNLIFKMFFVPFSTVFFVEQFPHLVNNLGYLLDGLPNSLGAQNFDPGKLNSDIANIVTNLFFTLHLAIAWSAYTLTSRWLGNRNQSIAPNLRNWMICLMCFPPFFGLLTNQFISVPVDDYMSKPAEFFFQSSHQWLVSVMILLLTALYCIYTAATVCFGMNYSNLSNRGILRKGPYAIVRHPAYGAKILALATVLLPVAIYYSLNGNMKAGGSVFSGLLIAIGVFYLRAITEEQHLSEEDEYRSYCEQVRFRFIPGLV